MPEFKVPTTSAAGDQEVTVHTPADRMVNGVPTCVVCGQFSSARTCWNCTQQHVNQEQANRDLMGVYGINIVQPPPGPIVDVLGPKTFWDHIRDDDDL